jgi:hypothetical protein
MRRVTVAVAQLAIAKGVSRFAGIITQQLTGYKPACLLSLECPSLNRGKGAISVLTNFSCLSSSLIFERVID